MPVYDPIKLIPTVLFSINYYRYLDYKIKLIEDWDYRYHLRVTVKRYYIVVHLITDSGVQCMQYYCCVIHSCI